MPLRAAGTADIAAISAIEQSAPSAWSEAQIASELRYPGGIVLIAGIAGERPVGWCCARLLPPEAELLKITVLPKYRQSGIGSRLLAELLRQAENQGCSEIFLEVRKNNGPARKFYRRHGFYDVALRKDYYQDPPDDAILFKRHLD